MENHKKHSLGRRAFFLFLSKRIKSVIFLFIVTAAVWWSERWVPAGYLPWVAYATELLFLISCAWFVFMLVQTYLEYRYYTYMFTEEAFIMTSGYMMRTEVAALYHQIQNVNIYRSPADRLAGVSKVVIFMTGNEKDSPHNKIVLPAVGSKKAKLVQKELLSRARRHFGTVNEAA
ncbi:MAG TPA: PH domain-containing protein [Candidatus Paceibacterota bacterium]|jgi:membrane protein YdbS with pleckstrin-like domain|nr:PH domain-containing protein [Candidatus Paceibacterota bacterium]